MRQTQSVNSECCWLLVLLALAPGCGLDAPRSETKPNGSGNGTPVDVAQVESSTFRETVRGIGTLEANSRVEIRPELDAIVREIRFREGQGVQQDEVLFVLDDSKLQEQLRERQKAADAAEATLAVAEKEFQRQDALRNRNVISQEAWDAAWERRRMAQAEVQRVQAAVALIRERIEDTHIVAPVNAVTSQQLVDVGDYVSTGDLLVTLYRQSPLEVAFRISERYQGRVEIGQKCELLVQAFPDQRFSAEVIFVSPRVAQPTRQMLIKASVDDPERRLKPGAFATVLLTVSIRENRPAVPEESLVATREGYAVFVVEEGVAKRRAVQVGFRKAGLAEIVQGVQAGETIVRAGHEKLTDGDQVRTDSPSENPS
jgi:membrane fusion protein (multidrug efflux system)